MMHFVTAEHVMTLHFYRKTKSIIRLKIKVMHMLIRNIYSCSKHLDNIYFLKVMGVGFFSFITYLKINSKPEKRFLTLRCCIASLTKIKTCDTLRAKDFK